MRPATLIRARSGAGDGFTIVEMLIAVAAVGLISVGLAKLFEKTGETVRIGRRVSNLNEVASMMERTMREDFSRMSPRGFLVIEHRLASQNSNSPQTIALTRDDISPRPRRIDQFVFFREGKFFTKREPLHPSRTAVATAARVYYGHGLRQPLDAQTDAQTFTPEVNHTNTDPSRPGVAPSFGEPGPNEFAADWILLRQETALCPPQTAMSANPPQGASSGPNNGTWGDSKIQIGLQPAAVDVFNIVAANYPPTQLPGQNAVARQLPAASPPNPLFASGIVDIAATDLSQVQARVLNAQPFDVRHLSNIQRMVGSGRTPAPFALEQVNLDLTTDPYSGSVAIEPSQSVSFPTQDPMKILEGWDSTSVSTTSRMKRWMIDAFPSNAYPVGLPDPWRERRVRCELQPPDLVGTVAGATPFGPDEAFRRTDQQMLSASNFVVGCTEFIVEWSYGKRYPSDTSNPASSDIPDQLKGQLIWHGLPRTADINGDGGTDGDEYVAHPYHSYEPSMTNHSPGIPVQTEIFKAFNADQNDNKVEDGNERWFDRLDGSRLPDHIFETALIHEPAPEPRDWVYPQETSVNLMRLFSCFGYVDPTFGHTPIDKSPRPGEPKAVAVPRPKLVRVTVSLVDQSEPLREQTYQFIFRLPDEGDQLPGT